MAIVVPNTVAEAINVPIAPLTFSLALSIEERSLETFLTVHKKGSKCIYGILISLEHFIVVLKQSITAAVSHIEAQYMSSSWLEVRTLG